MRFIDLLRMSGSNLFKRKVRTILTVLGVVIGVASIVVMVSLGLGLNKATMEQISNYASLTSIQVQEPWDTEGVSDKDKKHLDEALVEELTQIPHVISVDPYLNLPLLAKYGVYEGYIDLQATTLEAMENMNIEVGQGTLPQADAGELQLLFGNMVVRQFYKTTGGNNYNWDEIPDVDLMNDSIIYILDRDAYYGSMGGGTDENGKPYKKPKKHLFTAVGMVAGDANTYNNHSYNTYCDIEQLIPILKKEFKGRAVPGQPTTSKGKPYKDLYYSRLVVNVDDMENVSDVAQIISDMGYQTYNDAEWIESQQQQLGMIQAVLGGIGAVSLFVAAIGITNTMMMSIYERTKEIGVMKVLGCDMRNIGTLFLMEAGFIGFLGGVVGLILSYSLSGGINYLVSRSENMGMESISYIPFWLVLVSMGFAILVGMVAGFFPARRAMKLSPLAAIRNE
ncbi:MAG: ABC transporter permease [Lachnospiraceae bacterium]|nr:ABC transporter permease [Lachnospiraceae bacterium]